MPYLSPAMSMEELLGLLTRAGAFGSAAAAVFLLILTAAFSGGCGGGTDTDTGSSAGGGSSNGGGLQIRSRFDDYGNAIATDDMGNVYIAGYVEDALPGQTNSGRRDAFIQKLDASLSTIWTRQFGTDDNDHVNAVAVDAQGGVYLAGGTIGELGGYTSRYFGSDGYVRAYDGEGAERWTRQFGTEFATVARAVAVDSSGNVYAAGHTEGSLPGFSNAGGAPFGAITSWNDAFLRKYDSGGTEVWTRQFGHERHDEIHGIAVDRSGGVYVIGYTDASFDGFTNSGGRDAFVRKYDADGNIVWTQQFGSASAGGAQPNDKGLGIGLDAAGNLYVVGSTTGRFSDAEGGGSDGFVRKMDPTGNAVWTRQFGGEDDDSADAVAVHADGTVFAAGNTESSIPGAGGAGVSDGFVKSFSSDGADRWTRTAGTRREDGTRGVAQSSAWVYVVGGTEGEIASGGAGKGSDMDSDVFVLRMMR